MFWVFSNCSGSCQPYLTKNSNLVFRCKIRCFKLRRNEYVLVCWNQNLSFFEPYITKNNVFDFCWETRCNQLYSTNTIFWFVCCNIGLFPVLLHQKKVFFQYAASHSDFHLILLKQRFCFLLAKLPCFRIIFLRTTLFSVFVTKLHFGHSILPKKCFGSSESS